MASSATAARAKLAASNANAGPVPMAATTTPASAGPTRCMNWFVTWTSPLAAGRRSDGTSIGMMVLRAGKKRASTAPKITASTARCHSSARPDRTRMASVPTTTERRTFEPNIRERGEKRSVSAPPKTISAARGIAAATRTVPRASPEPVRANTSVASATKWNWSPRRETPSPAQSRRKSRSSTGPRIGTRRDSRFHVDS